MTDTSDIEEWQWERADEMVGEILCDFGEVNRDKASNIALARMIGKHETRPVDPDLEYARQIAADIHKAIAAANGMMAGGCTNYLNGTNDNLRVVPLCLAAIKRGRELERGQ